MARWTEEQDLLLMRWCLRLNGRAQEWAMDTAIAHQLGRSVWSVKKRRMHLSRVLSAPLQRRDRKQALEVLRQREAGLSYSQIAETLGITKGSVAGILRDLRS